MMDRPLLMELKKKQIVLRNKNNVIYNFNVTSKEGKKLTRFKGMNMDEILQFSYTPG